MQSAMEDRRALGQSIEIALGRCRMDGQEGDPATLYLAAQAKPRPCLALQHRARLEILHRPRDPGTSVQLPGRSEGPSIFILVLGTLRIRQTKLCVDVHVGAGARGFE